MKQSIIAVAVLLAIASNAAAQDTVTVLRGHSTSSVQTECNMTPRGWVCETTSKHSVPAREDIVIRK